MIETKLLTENLPVVYHRLSGRVSRKEVTDGTIEAMSVVKSIVDKNEQFDLILDMRGYILDNLNAHRLWTLDFKEQKILQEHAKRVAIVGDNTETLETEKEMMESATLKFFTELDAAYYWLKIT